MSLWYCDSTGYNEVIGSLVDAWKVDRTEQDGSRTYAVYEAKLAMQSAGFNEDIINYAADFALSVYQASTSGVN